MNLRVKHSLEVFEVAGGNRLFLRNFMPHQICAKEDRRHDKRGLTAKKQTAGNAVSPALPAAHSDAFNPMQDEVMDPTAPSFAVREALAQIFH